MSKVEIFIYEFIILIRYSWLFFWRGGMYANEYLKGANEILKEIKTAKPNGEN